MPRHVAFLRGVTPTNARMPALKACFEAAGFAGVRTILGSGNVAFDARSGSEEALVRRIEAALVDSLGREFPTQVRPSRFLADLVAGDPYASFGVPAHAKRVVTFLRARPEPLPALPIARDNACILAVDDRCVFTAYEPHPSGPVFMTLIEKAFGKDVTTRTWDTLVKCAAA